MTPTMPNGAGRRAQWTLRGGEYSLATASSARRAVERARKRAGRRQARRGRLPGSTDGSGRDLRSHVVPSGGCLVSVTTTVWVLTLDVLAVILAVDLLVIARRPHVPTFREFALWVTGYIALAVAFGLIIRLASPPSGRCKFFAGWLTDCSPSAGDLR